MNTALPSFLHRTAEQIETENNRQATLSDLHLKGAKQSPAEERYAQAMLQEKAIRANLEAINEAEHPEAYQQTLLQLAEVLADQGKFDEALSVTAGVDDEAATHYQQLANGVAMDDEETCDCPPETTTLQERNARGEAVTTTVEIPTEFVAGEVYSAEKGKVVAIMKCSKCGFTNIKDAPAPPDLSAIEKRS